MSNSNGTPQLTEVESDMAGELLPPGGRVYVLERYTTRSGDTLYLQVLVVDEGEIRDITWLAGKVLDASKWKYSAGRKALRISAVDNGGTDYAFDLTDDLSAALEHDERLQHVWI